MVSVLCADSGFRLQRVGNSDGTPAYAGSFDERKNQPIRLVNPASIRRILALPEPLTDAARAALDAFSRRLEAQADLRFTLDPNSSDLLLVLLLPKIGRHLHALQRHEG